MKTATTAEPKKKFLQGAIEIQKAFGFSNKVFNVLLRLGMPVTRINKRIYAHYDNIAAWLQHTLKGGDFNVDESSIDGVEDE